MTTTAKHTPGPWRVSGDMRGINNKSVAGVVDSRNVAIAICGAGGQANARLIASAPDLLAALKSATEAIAHLNGIARNEQSDALEATCRAAIARAEGGAS